MDVPAGVYAELGGTVRAAVDVPVIAVGRIKTPEMAESILAAEQADIIAEARAFIAEPAWVDEVASAPTELRPCIGCNQGCYGNLVLVRPIRCTVNPAVGRETELGIGTRTDAGAPRRVLVLGGGPAGMEAAITAAQRGHDVVLAEASERVGGQVRLGASVPARAELADIVDFQERQLELPGVDVRLGTRLDGAGGRCRRCRRRGCRHRLDTSTQPPRLRRVRPSTSSLRTRRCREPASERAHRSS